MNKGEIERYDRCIRVLERAEKLREDHIIEKENIHDRIRERGGDDRERQKEKKNDERER